MRTERSGVMAVEVERVRRLFTVEEYQRMGAAGIFGPEERVELIDGEIFEMSPIGPRHAGTVMNLNRLLVQGLGDRAWVSPQNPVVIAPRSQPQPDLQVLRQRTVHYSAAHPTEADVLLAIEVADSSVRFDRTVKQRLYARAGIVEFWLVDTNAGRIDVHRGPAGDRYADIRSAARGQTVSPQAFPDLILSVDAILA
jgi:Uma2 family endonuclease